MSALDLASDAGLIAMVLLTINILLGLLLAARYNTVRGWPGRRLPIFAVHNWTAYVALGLIVVHPLPLLFSKTAGFGIWDVLVPVKSPHQTLYNSFGALAFYSVLLVVLSSYIRSKLGSRLWKKLHYVSYGAAALLFAHGLLIDPDLKEKPADFLDGEKILIEVCGALIAAASIWRLRYQPRKHAVGRSVEKSDYEAV